MKLVEQIKDPLNINSYEAKVWNALLSRGIASASELADLSKVPRSRCYDVLESLEKKGFVFQKVGKPIKYIANEPSQVMENLKKEISKEERRVLALFDHVKETPVFEELKSLYHTGIQHIDNNDITTSLMGRTAIQAHIKDMFLRAKKPITIHTTEEGVKRKVKIAKKHSSVPVTIFAPVSEIARINNIVIRKKDTTFRIIHTPEEVLFFTTSEDVENDLEHAVWMKGSFISSVFSSYL